MASDPKCDVCSVMESDYAVAGTLLCDSCARRVLRGDVAIRGIKPSDRDWLSDAVRSNAN